VHVSTTLEEMNTAIAMRSQAFVDINTHLASFGLGHVDIAATFKRKSGGRGYATLTMPNGGGVFYLDGKLAGRTGYNPTDFKIKQARNVKMSNARTQTKCTQNNIETQVNMTEDEALMSDEEDLEEAVDTQRTIPDDFKD